MIFVDTGAWYAAEVEDDVNHMRARGFLKDVLAGKHGSLVTSDYVLDEILTLLATRKGTEVAAKFLSRIRQSKSLRLVWIGEELFWKASTIFSSSKNKRWSFTDCTSFVLMRELEVSKAFAFDSHFEEAGYLALPD